MHGDEFDDAIRMPRWQNLVGAFAYDSTIWLQTFLNGWRQRAGLPRTSWALRAREGLGLADRFIRQWEEIALAHAERLGQDGIICGHVHTPRIRQADRLAYINVGDWVENGVGLVEELDGSFRHVNAESVARVPSDAAAMPLSSAHGHLETPRDRQVETTEEVAGQPTW
jgi:UDP-2,3-diacylglucosamine pyrophosphatase LpxH